MSDYTVQDRLRSVKKRAREYYRNSGYFVYTIDGSPMDLLAIREVNRILIEVRQIKVTDGPASKDDEAVIRKCSTLAANCTREICSWTGKRFETRSVN
jgi:hypothetical protein